MTEAERLKRLSWVKSQLFRLATQEAELTKGLKSLLEEKTTEIPEPTEPPQPIISVDANGNPLSTGFYKGIDNQLYHVSRWEVNGNLIGFVTRTEDYPMTRCTFLVRGLAEHEQTLVRADYSLVSFLSDNSTSHVVVSSRLFPSNFEEFKQRQQELLDKRAEDYRKSHGAIDSRHYQHAIARETLIFIDSVMPKKPSSQ